MASASTIKDFFILIGFPFSSNNPPAWETPTKVESESNKSVKRRLKIAGIRENLRDPKKSGARKREKSGAAKKPLKSTRILSPHHLPSGMEKMVVNKIPKRRPPLVLRRTNKLVIKIPAIKVIVSGVIFPIETKLTGLLATNPPFLRPIKAIKNPIPQATAF